MRRFIVLAGIAVAPSAAWADDMNSLFVAGGPLLGAPLDDGPNGLLVGAELSGGWLHMSKADDDVERPFWLGAYTDVLYDSAAGAGRASFGPELGYFMFGLDGGVVRELGGSGRWGFAGRGSLSAPVSWGARTVTTVSLYLRGVTWRDDSAGHTEVGVLVKWVLGN